MWRKSERPGLNMKKRFIIDLLVKYHYNPITKRLNENEPRLHMTELHNSDNCWHKATKRK